MTAGKTGRHHGVTLIELLVTIAVVAILVMVAVPGFRSMMASNRLASDYNEVLSGLNFARSEAIKRRETVAVELTSGSPWGYRVYLPGDVDAGDLRGREGEATLAADIQDLEVRFDELGRVEKASDCASGCDIEVSYASASCRAITVNRLGRIGRAECSE